MDANSILNIVLWEMETQQNYPRCQRCKVLYADYETKDIYDSNGRLMPKMYICDRCNG